MPVLVYRFIIAEGGREGAGSLLAAAVGGWEHLCAMSPPCPAPPGWAGAQNGAQAALVPGLGKNWERMGKNASS